MRRWGPAAAAGALLVLAGCDSYLFKAPVVPPAGFTYTNVSAPAGLSAGDIRMGDRVGRAKTVSILGLFAFGDSSVQVAARKAGIGTIEHVDASFFNILGVYMSYETIVSGTAAAPAPPTVAPTTPPLPSAPAPTVPPPPTEPSPPPPTPWVPPPPSAP
ncbi:MAG: TRL-like family protein [Planctomycetota bacterium]